MKIRLILTLIWWIWGAALIAFLAVLSLFVPLFGDDTRAAWEWFMPNLLPAMALVGGIQYQASRPNQTGVAAETPAAEVVPGDSQSTIVSIALSVLYLFLMSLSLGSTLVSDNPIERLLTSNLWLGPILTLTMGALGVVFVKK